MKFGKPLLAVLAVAFLLSSASTATAGNPMEKLGRGIANIAFGAGELCIQPWDVNREMGGVAAITYGVIRGVVFTVARVCVGVVDIVTFPFPLPGCADEPTDVGWGYGPLMRPAWVFDTEHNPYGFFYDDDSLIQRTY
ncbi:MAG: exosortase system-associated protein, TIGR04073 family [Victivallaceae bacterium]|nr:exosortase system-associated protein, TIGR04073 family [Victivallaceae bacterium]